MQKVDCEKYAHEILDKVKESNVKKILNIISVGDNAASESYIKGKIKDCEYCKIPYSHLKLHDTELLRHHINRVNFDEAVGGIIVQLPLPEGTDEHYYTNIINSAKDVDGFKSDSPFKPCTPEGIIYVLKKELGDLTGYNALVIGRGNLVGKPIVQLLLDENCTVTIAHSKTTNLDELIVQNEIIVCAVGKPNFLDLSKCKANIVVDVGVNRDNKGKLCGDCFNFVDTGDGMKVTPVPKGIGLMTRAMLMSHMMEN